MIVIDTHLASGASTSGFAFHGRGGPYGRGSYLGPAHDLEVHRVGWDDRQPAHPANPARLAR